MIPACSTVNTRLDGHAATHRLRALADDAGVQLPRMHAHMLHTFVTTMLDAGVSVGDMQIAARHDPPHHHSLRPGTKEARPLPPTTSSPPTWPPAPNG
jgi:hypothetical protein